MHRFSWVLVVFVTAGTAQVASFGVKGGIPVTRALPYRSQGQDIHTGRWTVGPTVEFHLPARLSVEIDGLYRAYHLDTSMMANLGTASSSLLQFRQDVRAWDFPLMLKYRFTNEPVRPFVTAGFQWTRESSDFAAKCDDFTASCPLVLLGSGEASLNRAGPVAGAGVGVKVHKFVLSPEVRYTRLNKPGTNQVTLLFGVTF